MSSKPISIARVVALMRGADLVQPQDISEDSIFSVLLNVGSKDGVVAGQRFLVYELGPEIFDPVDGNSLGNLELLRGEGRVSHVQEKLCRLDSSRTVTRPKAINALLGVSGKDLVDPPTYQAQAPFLKIKVGDLARPV